LVVKIFWDTNLFIYLWEKRTLVREMAVLENFVAREGHRVATSSIIRADVGGDLGAPVSLREGGFGAAVPGGDAGTGASPL
jgi:hypothetical protein